MKFHTLSKSQNPSPTFWRNRRVLLTGHTGFKGTWLAFWLNRYGAKLHGYSLPVSPAYPLYQLLNPKSQSTFADLNSPLDLKRCVLQSQPEIIFHLAAQSIVKNSYENPLETFSTNIMGTVQLLDLQRQYPTANAIVIVTSDKCYAQVRESRAFQEGDPLGGDDPYSASKSAAELVSASYRSAFFEGRKIATARAGNCLGGGDWGPHRLIPDLARARTQATSLQIRHPQSIRPWQHVFDPLVGYLLLAEHLFHDPGKEFAQAWNFGPEACSCVSVNSILEFTRNAWSKFPDIQIKSNEFSEVNRLEIDSSLAQSQLGWKPRWRVEEAVRQTALWYEEFFSRPDHCVDYSHQQIDLYLDSVR